MPLATTEYLPDHGLSRTTPDIAVKSPSGSVASVNNESTSNGGYRSGKAKQEAGSA